MNNTYLVVVPGAMMSSWMYRVEAMMVTKNPSLNTNVTTTGHCDLISVVLKSGNESKEMVTDEDIGCGLFSVDEDCLDLYLSIFYSKRR